MGRSPVVDRGPSVGYTSGKVRQDGDTRVSASQHRTGRVQRYATKLPEIGNHGKTISGSGNEGSQLCGTKGANRARSTGEEQNRKEISQRFFFFRETV